MEFQVDASEVEALYKSMGNFPKQMRKPLRQAVEVSARNVKDGARKHLRGQMRAEKSRLQHLPAAIGYTMLKTNPTVQVAASIEPQDGNWQAPLGAIIEGGSPTSPPKPFMKPALADEVEGFQKGILKAVEDAWEAM